MRVTNKEALIFWNFDQKTNFRSRFHVGFTWKNLCYN